MDAKRQQASRADKKQVDCRQTGADRLQADRVDCRRQRQIAAGKLKKE
jgi:hypothetical protein